MSASKGKWVYAQRMKRGEKEREERRIDVGGGEGVGGGGLRSGTFIPFHAGAQPC